MRTCLCGHDAAEHHLDRRSVECWGGLAYAETTDAGFLIAHCDCRAYEPAPREALTA